MVHFEIKNLSFYYPANPEKMVLDDISLTIPQGEFITVCGKSGSGKTTLLRHLKTVLTPHGIREGEIYFNKKSLEQVDFLTQSSQIGYVMQNPDNQIVTDKVWHELAFGLESLGYETRIIRLKVAEMASYFGIQDWFHKNVSELSGGQKQLLNLASIMAMQPKVLILDEPTSQLDPIAASDFLNTVRKINRELGITIIITEHRLEDILYASDRVVVLEKGRVLVEDRPENVGRKLRQENHPMFTAMPAPVQIYHGVKSIYENKLLQASCPLTVGEGARWLEKTLEGVSLRERVIKKSHLDFKSKSQEIAIELKEVWFRYEKEAADVIKGVSLKISKNTFFAILGGNGTGKSTLLKNICGICLPYRGRIFIRGKRLDKYKGTELFGGILAMLPQDPLSLFVHKTVKEDLEEMLPPQDEKKEERIRAVARECEITDLLASHPYDLSGGEQQRAALAMVLLTEPEILLLDEPTKGIDSFFKNKLGELLGKLNEKGMTIIMVSHDVEFCARYAKEAGLFFDGEIITSNTVNSFFSGNSFYTTAANRMSRNLFENAVTNEEVIKLCQASLV